MEQATAIIHSEGVFINSSPLSSHFQTNATDLVDIFELGGGALRISALGKACVERLLKRARIIPNRAIATLVRTRQLTVWSMIGPNRAAVFNRGRE